MNRLVSGGSLSAGVIVAIIISIIIVVVVVGATGAYLYMTKPDPDPVHTDPTPEELAAQKQIEEIQKLIEASKAAAAAAKDAAAKAAAEAEAKRLAEQQAALIAMLQNACKMSCGTNGTPKVNASNQCSCTPCLNGYSGVYCEIKPGPTPEELAELERQRIAALRAVNTAKCVSTCGDHGTPTLLDDNVTCTCKPCLDGYTGALCDVPKVCPNQCLNGGVQDPVTCACTCNASWKGADCSIRNCDGVVCGGGVANPNNNCACVCNPGYHLEMGVCVQDVPCAGMSCPNGQMSPTTCGCISCNAGYDLVSGNCVPVCASGFTRDQSGVCVRTSCPPGQTLTNGVCIVEPCAGMTCQNGTMNTTTCKCSSCNAGYDLVAGTCQPACGQYFTRDQFGTCVRTSCPPGQNLTNGVCVSDPCAGMSCPNGSMNPSTCMCSSCNAGYDLVAGTCQPACAPYFTRNLNGTCVRTSCPSGQNLVDGVCVSDPCAGMSCPNGTMDPSTCQCVSCTSGYELYNNACVVACPQYFSRNASGVCIRTSCPPGETLSGVGGTCSPIVTSCPTGYTLINGICEKNAEPVITCNTQHGIADPTTGTCSSCDYDYTGVNCDIQKPWDFPTTSVTKLIRSAVNTPLYIKTPSGKQTQILDDCSAGEDNCRWVFTPISVNDGANNPNGLPHVYYIQPKIDLTKYLRVGGGSVWFGAKPSDTSGAWELRQATHGGSFFFRPLNLVGQYLGTVGVPAKDGTLQTSSACVSGTNTKGCEWMLE